MKKQLTIHLDPEIVESIKTLQELMQQTSRNRIIEDIIQRGLADYRQDYRNNGKALPPKPKSDREKYGKSAWDKGLQEIYGT